MNPNEVSPVLQRDLFHMLCGAQLGEGVGRIVYEHSFDPTVVIKFESNAGSFQNVIEWETWQRVKNADLAKWFAPCVAISPNGSVLVQKRTCKPTNYPDKVPSFFTDIKLENFGMLGKQFVAHDYGLHLLMENGMSTRMKKANWILR